MPKLAELTRKSEARLEITSLWDDLSKEEMEANQSINPDVIRIVRTMWKLAGA